MNEVTGIVSVSFDDYAYNKHLTVYATATVGSVVSVVSCADEATGVDHIFIVDTSYTENEYVVKAFDLIYDRVEITAICFVRDFERVDIHYKVLT